MRALAVVAFIASLLIATLVAFTTTPAAAQSSYYDTPTSMDEAAIAFWSQRRSAAADAAELAGVGGDRFPNLPPVWQWRYATFYCEPEQSPPEGWLRPGGYCDQVAAMRSLIYSGTAAPRSFVPHN